MPVQTNVPEQIAQALQDHHDQPALVDRFTILTYGQLADLIKRLQAYMPTAAPVAVFGKPSAIFGGTVTACVVSGRPFVHLDPAMPEDVLHNILAELAIDLVFVTEQPLADQLPAHCTCVDVLPMLDGLAAKPASPVKPAHVAANDIIYIVATSGTTGKPKCIPVTQVSAYLSYAWRDAYTPYGRGDRVGCYIFAIWEMFRPLRNGASVHFAQFSELMNPNDLVRFWQRSGVNEMLFTPSALEKALMALPAGSIPNLSLRRIVLNGEVVSDDLIAAVRQKLPDVTLWNLYSICETHDICVTDVTGRAPSAGPVSVGVPMPHLRAVVLDDNDQVCPVGQPGLLHFEGPDMLGPGYINRPEETALRFRNLQVAGRDLRLYDTGDQGYVDDDGAVFVIGRIAHMLKLRGQSIQTRELTESLRRYFHFSQAVPWIKDVAGQGKVLVIYFNCDADQAARNAENSGLTGGQMRTPSDLSKAMRKELPAYCVPSYLVQLNEIPINAVSGKYDYKRLPDIIPVHEKKLVTTAPQTLVQGAKILCCPIADLDPALSFHDQGGDSLMAVTYLMALEKSYGRTVDFDFALNVPLGRLHDLLSDAGHQPQTQQAFSRSGLLLTGATGFLGSRVLAAAARTLPEDQIIYCVIREKRRAATDRLLSVAATQGIEPDRLVLISASIDDDRFGLDPQSYASLAACVTTVIHCAAIVNLAVDRDHSKMWAQTGIANILQFCKDANADLRFSSSSAVYPDVGGPFAEGPATPFDGCSGYGAAKLEAEAQIMASGVCAAIVRLPSLYDLAAPNAKDIYEIIMAACVRSKTVPEGFTFRMVDVNGAAGFLVGLTPQTGASFYNYGPDAMVSPAMIPEGFTVLPQDVWLATAPLSDAERALIAADKTVLQASSRFENGAAKAAWQHLTGTSFANTTDPAALIAARFTSSLQHLP